MAITPLPPAPSRQDPANFAVEGDLFLGALPQFGSELNQSLIVVEQALPAAEAAIGAANYKGVYNAATTYQVGQSVSFTVSGEERIFVAKTINTGITPTSGANWFEIPRPRTPDFLLINSGVI